VSGLKEVGKMRDKKPRKILTRRYQMKNRLENRFGFKRRENLRNMA
jgi:hypothetical protein